LSETFLIKRIIQRDIVTSVQYTGLHLKHALFFSDCNDTWIFRQVFEKSMKVLCWGWGSNRVNKGYTSVRLPPPPAPFIYSDSYNQRTCNVTHVCDPAKVTVKACGPDNITSIVSSFCLQHLLSSLQIMSLFYEICNAEKADWIQEKLGCMLNRKHSETKHAL